MTPPAQDSITPLNGNHTKTLGGHPVVGLIIAFAICFGAAALGSLATAPEIGGWYQTLNKPSWQPPNWLFGPVWSLLFAMMAISAWLVWRHSGFSGARTPLLLFAIQLILNVVWSWLFFRLHRPDWAFFEIMLLWVAILMTMLSFFGRSTTAGWLLVPYLAWVSFAAILNLTIWRLNPT
jgi:tryptophan-rich sensory protein